jgi:hypothetical protein
LALDFHCHLILIEGQSSQVITPKKLIATCSLLPKLLEPYWPLAENKKEPLISSYTKEFTWKNSPNLTEIDLKNFQIARFF